MNKAESHLFIIEELTKELKTYEDGSTELRKTKEEILQAIQDAGRSQASAYRDFAECQEQLEWDDPAKIIKQTRREADNELIFEAFRKAIPLYQEQGKLLEACNCAVQFSQVKKTLRSF